MNIAANIVAWIVALGLVPLALRFAYKEKLGKSVLMGVLAAVLCLSALPSFQGFIKTDVIGRTIGFLEAYGKKLDEFQKTTEKMRGELNEHQTRIDKHQTELNEQ